MRTKNLLAAGLLAAAVPAIATANTPVRVTVTGTVFSNAINSPPLSNAMPGSAATLTFLVDADVFTNHPTLPTRGYPIDTSSFVLTLGSVSIGLQNPFPGTPYFVLRDNDPAVDGFFVSTDLAGPVGVPLAQGGVFGAFRNNFYVTYTGSLLSSLDLLAAVGSYGFSGLTVFNWTIDDGPFNPMLMDFATLEIEALGATLYCQGKQHSGGCTPALGSSPGLPALSGGPWHVTAASLLNNQPCVVIWGLASNNGPFQGGTLCVLPPVVRTPVQQSGGNPPPFDCSGAMQLDLTSVIPPALVPVTVYVQLWGRDPGDPFTSSLSNALEVLVGP